MQIPIYLQKYKVFAIRIPKYFKMNVVFIGFYACWLGKMRHFVRLREDWADNIGSWNGFIDLFQCLAYGLQKNTMGILIKTSRW